MKLFLTTACLAAALTMTGCASIFSGSTQTLTFKSVPDTANITITNKLGEKIHTGSTPATVTLKRGNGYFKPAGYQVTFSKEGFQTKTVQVKATVNGWYIANIIFGGLIGFLIVDPATGAMYTLSPSDINTLLDATQLVTTKKEQQSLTVMLVQDIPVDMMKRAQYIATL
ncbi:hypothetical protein [Acinetobacter bohemicus]|jgi:hypothetical protein|uniref:hypothetical protein n=1 Tax=Acinetobacter bohemicus TaxID=1435036 RepID=UPI00192A8DDD|nr:hypothetical protein [Acinetobacter bohemicus]CAD9196625.1 hypothetical protein QAC21B_02776 [Acinetobacter bohemicus]